jgi:flagellin-like hook-associated protein FlgL
MATRGALSRVKCKIAQHAYEVRKRQGTATLQQKAVIFAESRRTQEYLFRILEQTGFAGKVMLFNGTSTDLKSKKIYRGFAASFR